VRRNERVHFESGDHDYEASCSDPLYSAVELKQIREKSSYDATETPSMKQLCVNTESGPLDFPLHPGAEKYYREMGYL